MDQTTLENKIIFWRHRECGESQIWIAISVYVLIAIIKKRLKLELELYTILQILSLSLFEKNELNQLLTNSEYNNDNDDSSKQLNLFDLTLGH